MKQTLIAKKSKYTNLSNANIAQPKYNESNLNFSRNYTNNYISLSKREDLSSSPGPGHYEPNQSYVKPKTKNIIIKQSSSKKD